MHNIKSRLAFVLALVLAATELFAVHPPDGFVRDEAAYARRGALGADHYVVTNVTVMHPSYLLVTTATTNLTDRAMQSYQLDAATTFVLPPPSPKREADLWRPVRSFLLALTVQTDTAPEVRFVGAGRIYHGDGDFSLSKGLNLLQFIEFAEGDFLIENRKLDPTD